MNLNPRNGDRLTKNDYGDCFIWDFDFKEKSGPYRSEKEARDIIAKQNADRAAGYRETVAGPYDYSQVNAGV